MKFICFNQNTRLKLSVIQEWCNVALSINGPQEQLISLQV